ncbi:NHL domain-containing thioredoxin family protein [Kineococcus sp. GCM10028916]|uniref:NHL domain-containing thioredoxin family protein n=1 Tax=Kineococcus sp. GCM10028916 TaxID=3273394 RepID=UPI0036258DCD
MTSTPVRRPRVRAPQLVGRRWLNTEGNLSLADLRGKIVLLDFWTSCCVNCLHVLDELRPLEEKFADVLVTVGVHSPKFAHEAEPATLDAAVDRYAVHHPVLDDPQLTTWQAYAARAWPTLVVVDPTGYVVASMSGEGHAHGLDVLVSELVAEHEAAGTLRRGDSPYVPPAPAGSALRFPSRVVRLPDGGALVVDTGHHQLVELDADLETERRRFGTGARGFTPETFAEPQGAVVLPPEVADQVGYDVVVADSVNHALRGLSLSTGSVVTIAGTGSQLRRREGGGPALEQDLSTPWDVAWFDGQVVIAMAGVHQLWAFDPVESVVRVLAGTTAEGIKDGPAEEAWFAQTSGLAVSPDGSTLWLVDAETSALRSLRRSGSVDRSVPVVSDDRMANVAAVAGPGYVVETHVGQGLFDFGFCDGPAAEALLQHPLGVAVAADGSILVADTYNGALRRFDPATGEVSTLVRDLVEPSDVLVDGDTLVVVESSAHRLTRELAPASVRVDGSAHRVQRPPTDLAPGVVALSVSFTPPTGQKLDDRWGDPTRLTVASTPPEFLVSGAGSFEGLSRTLEFAPGVENGVLHVSVQAAACDGDPETGEVPEFAACHLYQQDWGIPVRLVEGAASDLPLDLRGA